MTPTRVALAAATGALLMLAAAGPSFPGSRPEVPVVKLPAPPAPGEQQQRPITPEQVPPGALVPKGPPPGVGFFATGDVIGYLEPCG